VFQKFLPIISILSILFAQIATFILFYSFDKSTAGKVGIAFLWAGFLAKIVFFGGEQSLVKRLLDSDDSTYITGFSLYAMITSTLFLCSIPLVFLFGYLVNLDGVEYIFIITFLMLLTLQWLEIFTKVEGKYHLYYIILFFSGLLLIASYLLAGFYSNVDLFSFIFGHRVIVLCVTVIMLLQLYRSMINHFSIQGWLKILKSDYAFVMLLTISLINVFIDRIFVSATVESASYADYMIIIAIYSLAIMPKALLANQYLILLKTDMQGYFDKVKKMSIIFVPVILLMGFIGYWFITAYLLVDYIFMPHIFGILAISALIEVTLGPAGMVITYRYHPKYNLLPEVTGAVSFVFILLSNNIFDLFSTDHFLLIAIALATSKVVIAWSKLITLKRLKIS